MLREDMENLGDEEDLQESGHHEEIDLLEQLNKLALNEDKFDAASLQQENSVHDEPTGLKEATKGWLNPNNPIFSKEKASSKVKNSPFSVLYYNMQRRYINGRLEIEKNKLHYST